MKRPRRAAPADRPAIEDFQRTAYARTEAIIGAPAIPLEWDYGAVMEECEIWLDERDGLLVGVLILRVLTDRLVLESIATAEQTSGYGLGRALMEVVFARARDLGLDRVALITNSLNPAAAWYRKLGFTIDRQEQQSNRLVLHMSAPAGSLGRGG